MENERTQKSKSQCDNKLAASLTFGKKRNKKEIFGSFTVTVRASSGCVLFTVPTALKPRVCEKKKRGKRKQRKRVVKFICFC